MEIDLGTLASVRGFTTALQVNNEERAHRLRDLSEALVGSRAAS